MPARKLSLGTCPGIKGLYFVTMCAGFQVSLLLVGVSNVNCGSEAALAPAALVACGSAAPSAAALLLLLLLLHSLYLLPPSHLLLLLLPLYF